MKHILIVLVSLLSMGMAAQENGIQFEHDKSFSELKAMAKAQDKLLFMDCYTTWCGPCKQLAANIFTLAQIGDFYNTNFINCKFDMEKGEGIDIGKQYEVRAYPTLLFINGDGEMVHKKIGGGTAQDILELGKNANDKENNFMAVSKRIKNNTYSSSDIKNFLNFNKYGSNNDEVLDLFFKGLNANTYYTVETWEVIEAHLTDLESDFGKFLIQNREKYNSGIGKQKVDAKLQQLFAQGIHKAKGDESAIAKYKAIDPALAESTMLMMDINNAYGMLRRTPISEELINNFATLSEKYASSDLADAAMMNRIAWDIYEHFKNGKMSDQLILKSGLKLSTKMVELAPENPAFLDTHAHLLALDKDLKGAIDVQTKAIALLKKKGEPTENYEKALQEMKDALYKIQ